MTAEIEIERHLAELRRLIDPAPGTPPRYEWPRLEAAVGFALPTDYRRLMDEFGGGYLDDHLYLVEPDCPNPHYDFASHAAERIEALEYLWGDGFEQPPPELAEGTGARALPWAATDNGECLFWLARPGKAPDEWTVMVNEGRGPYWESFDVGCLKFLVGVMTGRIDSEILAYCLTVPRHTYVPILPLP